MQFLVHVCLDGRQPGEEEVAVCIMFVSHAAVSRSRETDVYKQTPFDATQIFTINATAERGASSYYETIAPSDVWSAVGGRGL